MSQYDNRKYTFNGEVRRRKIDFKKIIKGFAVTSLAVTLAVNSPSIINSIKDYISSFGPDKVETEVRQTPSNKYVDYLKVLNPKVMNVMAKSLSNNGWIFTMDKDEDTLDFFFDQVERVHKEGTTEQQDICREYYTRMMSASLQSIVGDALRKRYPSKNVDNNQIFFSYDSKAGTSVYYLGDHKTILADNMHGIPLPNILGDAIHYLQDKNALKTAEDYENANACFGVIFSGKDIDAIPNGTGFASRFDKYYSSKIPGGMSNNSKKEFMDTYLNSLYHDATFSIEP